MGVLTAQAHRPRRAAQRDTHEEVREGRTAVGDERSQLRHRRDPGDIEVVGHDEEDVRPPTTAGVGGRAWCFRECRPVGEDEGHGGEQAKGPRRGLPTGTRAP